MDKKLLEILACPRCRKALVLKQEDAQDVGLICPACCIMFPIRDDIPIMLVEEAITINKDDIPCAS